MAIDIVCKKKFAAPVLVLPFPLHQKQGRGGGKGRPFSSLLFCFFCCGKGSACGTWTHPWSQEQAVQRAIQFSTRGTVDSDIWLMRLVEASVARSYCLLDYGWVHLSQNPCWRLVSDGRRLFFFGFRLAVEFSGFATIDGAGHVFFIQLAAASRPLF